MSIMVNSLLESVEVQVVSNAVAAGTTDINTTEVDMEGFESVMWICQFGAITSGAVTSIKAQQDTATGMASAADLAGTGQTVADTDDNTAFLLNLVKPQERFVRLVVDRGTQNAVVESCVAIKYNGKAAPITQGATIGGSETTVSPAEGTA